MSQNKNKVVIVGGGAAGVSTANNMLRQDASIDITLIEPCEKHYYQPAFTTIGGGAYTLPRATKLQKDIINPKVNWIKQRCASFQPNANTVTLQSGDIVAYDYLVVCPGLQLDFAKIDGLAATLGKNGVCSNYSVEHVEYTWETLQKTTAGNVLFTQPPMPIKCAGAPQKIMYLAADRFIKQNCADKTNVEFFNAGPGMFGVPFFAKALVKVAADYGIKTNFSHNLIAVDGASRTATFETTAADGSKTTTTREFAMIHITPPQSAPDFIKTSPLADQAGWVDVDHHTLQHKKFANIFGLGDATCTPNAKTAAAVRKQVPVVVDNILHLIQGEAVVAAYQGYGACPLTTSGNTAMLAEFSYGGKVTPSFPFLDPRNNSRLWWWGKIFGFPWLYWQIMIKGLRIDLPSKESYVANLTRQDK